MVPKYCVKDKSYSIIFFLRDLFLLIYKKFKLFQKKYKCRQILLKKKTIIKDDTKNIMILDKLKNLTIINIKNFRNKRNITEININGLK